MDTYYGTKRIQAQQKMNGYVVQYEDGYESFSPVGAFEKAYRKSGEMNFGHALEALKEGRLVSRSGWNGKGMYLFLLQPSDKTFVTLPYIAMRTACANSVPWLASQTDMLAEDWCIID